MECCGMEAILDRIDEALEVAGVPSFPGMARIPNTRIKHATYKRADGTPYHKKEVVYDWSNYQFQIGDGVTLAAHGACRGRIEWLDGTIATVVWEFGKTGIEKVSIDKLDYLPTLENIRVECEQIQHELKRDPTNALKRERENYPSPEVMPHSTRFSDCVSDRKSINTSDTRD
jgi:hypothetical protein